MFTVGQTIADCRSVLLREQAPLLAPNIERTARNDKIASLTICHDDRRGVYCVVRGRRNRECRRLFSNKPCFEHAGARRGDRLEPGEPLGCLVRKRKSRLDFGPGHTDEPAFFGYGQHRRLQPAIVHGQHPAHGSRGPDRAGRQRACDFGQARGLRHFDRERREWRPR